MSALAERLTNRNILLAGTILAAGAVALGGVKYAFGSPSPLYRQAYRWQRYQKYIPDDAWLTFKGDPNASKYIRRFWKNAGVFMAPLAEIEALREDCYDCQDALAYIDKEKRVKFGIIPGGFGAFNRDGEQLLSVAGRIGRDDLNATMTLWSPSQRTLLIPEGIGYVGVSIEDLADKYPQTPLV